MIVVMTISILALIASPAVCQERTEEECKELHPRMLSPVEYATCTSDLIGSKQRLNSAYAELRLRVSAEYQELLVKAQTAWLRYRDTQCAYDAGAFIGGTAHTSDVITCTANMNRERAKYFADELERWSER